MGIRTEDFEYELPLTKDEADYINARRRLREVLRVNGDLDALKYENLVDDDGNPLPEREGPRSDVAPPPITSQPEDRGRQAQRPVDPTEPTGVATGDNVSSEQGGQAIKEPFQAIDRSEWTNEALKEEIISRNEKIEAYNEDIEDEALHWKTLPKSGNKDELVGVLAQHDRFIYDYNASQPDTEGEGDGTADADADGDDE